MQMQSLAFSERCEGCAAKRERGNGMAGAREERRGREVEDATKDERYCEERMCGQGERKEGEGEKDHVAITVQFVQLTFIMSPSDGVDRAGERLRA